MPVLPKNVLDEAGKNVQGLSTWLFNIRVTQQEVSLNHVICLLKCNGFVRKTPFCDCLSYMLN